MIFTEQHRLRAGFQTGFRQKLATTQQLQAMQCDAGTSSLNHDMRAHPYMHARAYDRIQGLLLWQTLQRLGLHRRMLGAFSSLCIAIAPYK